MRRRAPRASTAPAIALSASVSSPAASIERAYHRVPVASDYDPFAAIYDEWSAPMTEDIAFYVELAREAEGPIVELGVGNGRVAIPIARETGKRVLGIDSSPAMLELGRARVGRGGCRRRAPSRATCASSRSTSRQRSSSAPTARCSTSPPGTTAAGSSSAWPLHSVRAGVSPGTPSSSTHTSPRGTTAWRSHTQAPRRSGSTRSTRPATTGSTSRRSRSRPGKEPRSLSLWWVTKSEWEGLLDVSGLETEALYRSFDRLPFDDDANEFVWIARKPA